MTAAEREREAASRLPAHDPGATSREVAHPAPRRAGALLSWLAVALACALALLMVALRLAGWQPLAVLSDSMAPALREGDLIVVEQVPARTVAPGDVIAFARPRHAGETLTHRVVAVRGAGGDGGDGGRLAVTTRGDANPAPERWTIARDGEVGVVRARLPRVGALAAPLRGELSRAAVTITVTAIVTGAALWLIWRPRRGGGR
ncbi:signal peptidase I [Conexibacter stalactiti]|uniref:Signal peptidase I n=1 Tax=Conexibacter stalactiti TaxID=1940611 RepID=A0ABU4HTY7_9ACTN|nr:signal peptidase I [Conexibacter stalactiti]MDW5596000.1 signal peptidase I [Conexibacter stalactiti]MEC5036642.1 signal peptidase I [Conexibacter stalactiti]